MGTLHVFLFPLLSCWRLGAVHKLRLALRKMGVGEGVEGTVIGLLHEVSWATTRINVFFRFGATVAGTCQLLLRFS